MKRPPRRGSRAACGAIALGMALAGPAVAGPQQAGSIRGVVYDNDFGVPLGNAQVLVVETGERATATPEGNFVLGQVRPGKYTLLISKDGYVRQMRSDVEVVEGRLTEIEARLDGQFEDMEEFVVQDMQLVGGEAALLRLRLESPALLDSISAELMSRAGASDAASALRLVAGATVQDGKFAVIRGLPDRYVSSQLNGVRLPTADQDKRAVELDLFPASVIDSVIVSKTFTPDQQGDASGGAVNVRLKGIPDESILQLKGEYSWNSQASGRKDFLTYNGGGVNFWGRDDGSRAPQLDKLGQPWGGAAGVTRDTAPQDYKWTGAAGGQHEFDNGVKIGGLASFFYERDSAFYDNGIDDSSWVTSPGNGMTPQTVQGTPADGDFKTKLFDITKASESVQWGGLGTLGIESENHSVGLNYFYARTAEDTATLAEDTRGKAYFFPGYDPYDPNSPGNSAANRSAAPYLRTETLQYAERTTSLLQFHGEHRLPLEELALGDAFTLKAPELDWSISRSEATLYEPDKRQFGSLWLPEYTNPGFPPWLPPFTLPAGWLPFKPAANFTLGNLQRTWQDIDESTTQYALNLKLPFEQWSDSEGYFKFGVFDDNLTRHFDQDTFSNFNDVSNSFDGDWTDFWSAAFPFQQPGHDISDGPPFVDVDYQGHQKITAVYGMADVPLTSWLNVVGGARYESTDLTIQNFAEPDATWYPPGASAPVTLNPGDADVAYSQRDLLPSIGLVLKPLAGVTLRGSYNETLARQTFKELTPIQQQEFLGGDVFIGNPDLRMSGVRNYDLRLDWAPYEGGLVSGSWFKKKIRDPIEYVQRLTTFTYTTPVNYPQGELDGLEFELRQNLGHFWEGLDGLTVGGNATFINSSVRLPDDEVAAFASPGIQAPRTERGMTAAPNHLYNLYLTYDLAATGTQCALFYTVQGDSLVAGAGESSGNFVPDVYALEYGSLNFTVSQRLGPYFRLQFQAKNLTDPQIQEVYRSEYIGADVLKTSYTKGIDLSISLSASFTF